MKRVLLAISGALLTLALVVAVRTLTVGSGAPESIAAVAPLAIDEVALGETLAAAIRIETVSTDAGGASAEQIERFQLFLEQSFPRTFSTLERERLDGGALLLTWRGADATAPPIVLMAHQDVVPVAPGTEERWTYPPFAGVVADDFVWGRGALDDKGSLIAIFAAVERLLAERFAPQRTLLVALGADEEVGGASARAIVARVAGAGVRPALVLDEGMPISRGMVPGIGRPVAFVAVAEKGYATFELTVEVAPGHSSMPPEETAISILSTAMVRLTATPLPARPGAVVDGMFAALAPAAGGRMKLLLANRWLFGPLLRRGFGASAAGSAALRTTLAPTVIAAGNKENVLPGRARALVNLRLVPGDTVSEVERQLSRRIDDARVTLRLAGEVGASEASPVSRIDGWGYGVVARSVRQVVPEAVVAPGLMVGATDARHWTALSDQVFRFNPVLLGESDLAGFHGTDERLSIANLLLATRVYAQLIRNAAQ